MNVIKKMNAKRREYMIDVLPKRRILTWTKSQRRIET